MCEFDFFHMQKGGQVRKLHCIIHGGGHLDGVCFNTRRGQLSPLQNGLNPHVHDLYMSLYMPVCLHASILSREGAEGLLVSN
jgi:hypothetical protein